MDNGRSFYPCFLAGVLLLVALLATSCTTHGTTSFSGEAAPVIAAAEAMPPYRMQVGDALAIRFLLNPEFNEEVTIRPDGKISTAVAQDVQAFGRTPMELQKELDEYYRRHLSNPNTAVIVRAFAPTQIYVLGEVGSPGEHSFNGSPTLLQAIARAGGVRNSAKSDEILIMRRGYDDESRIYSANYALATTGLSPEADVRLAAYDVVYVPRTGVARAHAQFEQYVTQFIRPSVGFGVNR